MSHGYALCACVHAPNLVLYRKSTVKQDTTIVRANWITAIITYIYAPKSSLQTLHNCIWTANSNSIRKQTCEESNRLKKKRNQKYLRELDGCWWSQLCTFHDPTRDGVLHLSLVTFFLKHFDESTLPQLMPELDKQQKLSSSILRNKCYMVEVASAQYCSSSKSVLKCK